MIKPEVSVIIPAKNASSTIADCLLSLRAQTVPRERFEILVVDDGSTDNTAAIVEKISARDSRTRVLKLAAPSSGPAVARNRAVEVSRGSIIVFTDADCAPEPSFLEELLRPFDDESVIATKGIYRSDQKSVTARFVQAEYESRYRLMARCDQIDFVDTYAAAYRRDAFEEVGGFDESFPVPSVEDQELSFRLAARGARMLFCPDAVVTHRHAADPVSYLRKKTKIGYWKMRVLARFPEKARRDSHTPSTLKIQVGLAALNIVALPLVFFGALAWVPAGLLAVFLATSLPFAFEIARRDPVLGLAAPGLILGRAVALGFGMSLGILQGQLARSGAESSLRRFDGIPDSPGELLSTGTPDAEARTEDETLESERVVQHV